jgi:YYY domain-containing protein
VAAKLNTAPVVLLLPAALLIVIIGLPGEQWRHALHPASVWLVAGAVAAFLSFRILQPYAFDGPGFFDIGLNQDWLSILKLLADQSGPLADAPPALQWARRPIWFSGQNLVVWGLGLPLGLLAWTGFAVVGWQLIRRRDAGALALIWLWVGGYFVWQSLANNPTMRYQLPVYPGLVLLAAWGVSELWRRQSTSRWTRVAAVTVGGATIIATALWAFAFTRIYTRPVTRVAASHWIMAHLPGPFNLQIRVDQELVQQPAPCPPTRLLTELRPYVVTTRIRAGGSIESISIPRPIVPADLPTPQTLTATLYAGAQVERPLAFSDSPPLTVTGGHPEPILAAFDPPVAVATGDTMTIALTVTGDGAIQLRGTAIANESSWDDGLPLRIDGYDPFADTYLGDLSLELYWPDKQEKLDRFLSILDQADCLLISSSRQWGSIPRLPERYPLTTQYYRSLLGCPDELTVEQCYNHAAVGSYQGRLGFDLVRVETSHPNFGPWQLNDQAAEEAFTVYDHPKVLVFTKSADYSHDQVAAILGAVDLDRVIHVLPGQARSHPVNLLLPPQRLAEQRAGGTWSELYDRDALINRSPLMTVMAWYLAVGLLGLLAFPLVRLALPGLPDQGYGLARISGLVIVTWLVWIAGSFRAPFGRTTISMSILAVAVLAGLLTWRQRDRLGALWQTLRRQVVGFELLFLLLFVVGLLIRIGNPDLWHGSRGGEKPMELAYLNAVLKSSSFPPFDPWFAGGYLNYYYYGWLLMGVLVRWLGIVPTVAFNLILATLLALIGSGAYCLGRALVWRKRERSRAPLVAGLAAGLGMAVVGNLGSLQMVVNGCQRLVAGGELAEAGLLTRAWWTLQGLARALAGAGLGFSRGDWYWNPTRIIPDPTVRPITEFPFFSFLFGDLHPHLIDLPLTLLVIGWVISMIRWRPTDRPGRLQLVAVLLLGCLAVGALRPTNTWSFYTYLALAGCAVAYWSWRHWDQRLQSRLVATAAGLILLVLLAHLLYSPYAYWYGAGYTKTQLWQGAHTPLGTYLLHWGLFLFVIASWLVAETWSWLRNGSPRAWRPRLLVALLPAAALMALLLAAGVGIAWVAVPLAAWSGLLLVQPDLPDTRRLALFMLGTALAVTITVEVVVLQGDVGRMNTVFKLYMQAWTLLAVTAGAALGWLLPFLRERTSWRWTGWWAMLAALVSGALLYPVLATSARIGDRMAESAPHGIDGMAFMEHAVYFDKETALILDEDFRAIRWLQENVTGSPVIVEGHTVEYRWGSRISIYTGLPTVIGWNWHQRQQRTVTPHTWVWNRVHAVRDFYTTTDPVTAIAFLRKHQVSYIIVGQLERVYYEGPGLDKFDRLDGGPWHTVYQDGTTAIYQVAE